MESQKTLRIKPLAIMLAAAWGANPTWAWAVAESCPTASTSITGAIVEIPCFMTAGDSLTVNSAGSMAGTLYIDNNGGDQVGYDVKVKGGTSVSITNSGSLSHSKPDYANYVIWNTSGSTISTLTNNVGGVITSTGNRPASVLNEGTITNLTNYGSISSTGVGFGDGSAIDNKGNIGTIENYGTLTGAGGGKWHFGINNYISSGTPPSINTLVNGQAGLTYFGHVPSKYVTYFSDAATFGTVNFKVADLGGDYSAITKTIGTYGVRIATGQNWATGTFNNVVVADSALTISNLESVSGISYHLAQRNGGLNWDLVIDSVSTSRVYSAANALVNTPAFNSARIIDNNSNLLALFAPLTTNTQLSNAASQTLPILTGGMNQSISNALHSTNRIIQSRQEGQHGRSLGDEFLGDKHAWFKPFGSWANQDDRKGVSGYDANTYGMVFGADAEINDANRLGIAFAYARSNVDSNSNVAHQSADVNSYQLALYGSHNISDSTDINFQADIGKHDNSGLRDITFEGTRAKSDYTSWSGHVGAGLAHTYTSSDKTTLTPSIRADYTRVRDDSYNEKGAGALNLRVNSNTTEELILGVDGKLAHAFTDTATFTANLGLGYDVINEQASLTSAFAGAPTASFTTKGLDPSPWLMRGGLGIVSKATETVEISARYDIDARKDFDNQTASVKVRWAI